MNSNQDKKYPLSLFVIGFLLNLIKNSFLLFPGIALLIAGIWVKWCFIAGVGLLLLDVIISLIEQIQIRSALISSDDPNFNEWQDAILSPDWRKNIIDLTESKMNDTTDQESS